MSNYNRHVTVSTDSSSSVGRLFWFIFSLATAIIGYEIHGSGFWAVVDFIFAPLAWIKWMICQEVNLTIIKSAFDFFLK